MGQHHALGHAGRAARERQHGEVARRVDAAAPARRRRPSGSASSANTRSSPASATASRSGSATITAARPRVAELLGDLVGREQRVDRRDDRRRARRPRGTRPPSRRCSAPSRPTASPGPMPAAASPAAVARDLLGELGVGRHRAGRAVDQRRLVAARRRAAEHVLGERDRRDLDVGVRAAQDGMPRSLRRLQRRYAAGGGVETTKQRLRRRLAASRRTCRATRARRRARCGAPRPRGTRARSAARVAAAPGAAPRR